MDTPVLIDDQIHRIYRLHLWTGVRPSPPNECPVYDPKLSDGVTPVMLELWEMQSTPSLLSLPGPLWLEVAAPDSILLMVQIELFDV